MATNGSGSVLTTQRFDPWGKVIAGGITQTRRNFTGQYLDETGLLYYNARYYDPNLGRFISADSIVPSAGSLTLSPHDAVAAAAWGKPSGGPANPQDLNRYSYGLNNPLRNTDPTGHFCVGPVALVCVAVAGAYLLAGGGTIATQPSQTASVSSMPAVPVDQIAASLVPEWVKAAPAVMDTVATLAPAVIAVGELAVRGPLVSSVKGEYVPPGLRGSDRQKYREAIHRYKRKHGLPANYPVPKDILDDIAGAVKDGANPSDAADDASEPPEAEDESPPPRRGKEK